MRELLTTRLYFEGLTCRFDLPYPKAKMPSSGLMTHVFHLRSTNKAGPIVAADHGWVADVESAALWLRYGYNNEMAKLAGMPKAAARKTGKW